MIGAITTWQTDEPCPACGQALTLLDDGSPVTRWECRSCGERPGDADGGDW